MSPRVVVALVALSLIALLGLWIALRERPPGSERVSREPGAVPRASSPSSSQPAIAGQGAPASAPPVRSPAPRLPSAADSPEPSGAEDEPLWRRYESEARDPAWARERERAIRATLRPLLEEVNEGRTGAVQVPAVECRERSCRMLVTGGDEAAFVWFVEALQDERGFYGDAALLALDDYGEVAAGRAGAARKQIRVHLVWER